MAKSGIDLDAELDDLYASPLAEFVEARKALEKRLETGGRKEDAARVKALKKPNATAWGLNQLAFKSPRLLAALVASGDRLRAGPSDAREAIQKRRDAVHEARQAVERTLSAAGHAATPEVMRRVTATLEAIATWGSAPGGPVAGRLTEDVPAPGFDDLASLGLLPSAAAAPRVRQKEEPKRRAEPSGQPSKRDAARERALEERSSREAEKALAARAKEARTARLGLRATEKAVDTIRRKRASLQTALSKVTAEEQRLETELAGARKKSESADAAEREARSFTRK